ncbi:MAG: diaminopimelate decarboxylase [Myxococcales bacterium]|nr:diaminopimelate decarboxylase [Myxococcales bacterium]MDH5306480.1 diaminopimelate decarboxylase [Myxococcales bacterium]MDH5566921.1 diaminopimelate decarboxylase [Myxococcales bacterium]
MKAVDAGLLARLAREHGTPFYLYDAAVIRERLASLRAFDVVRYAQKACSNLHILRLLRGEGACVDAVSLGELERAVRAGFVARGDPAGIVYTADILEEAALERVLELDVPVNAGSADMLEQIGRRRRGHRVWIRVNPGFGHGHNRKTSTGGAWSKHGIWHAYLDEALRHVEKYRLDLVGLHMHIGSGADFDHLRRVCDAMVAQVRALGVDVRAISGGGGLPIPYRPADPRLDTDALYAAWQPVREEVVELVGHPVSLEIEPGRYLVAESGVLVAEVRATKRVGPNHFVLVDAGFNDLARPTLYGSHHEISIVKREGVPARGASEPTIVGGPLCESGDVFTQTEGGLVVPRDLPKAEIGDWLVLHDAGAYAASMASNYNTRTLAPEILLDGGTTRLIRRRQTIDELLALEDV